MSFLLFSMLTPLNSSPVQATQSLPANLRSLEINSQSASPLEETAVTQVDPHPQAVLTLYDASILAFAFAFGLTLEILALLKAQRHSIVLFVQAFFVYGFAGLYVLGLQKRVRPPVASWYFREDVRDGLRHLKTLLTPSNLLSALDALTIWIERQLIQLLSLYIFVVISAGTAVYAIAKQVRRVGWTTLSHSTGQRVRNIYSHSLVAIVAVSAALFLTRR